MTRRARSLALWALLLTSCGELVEYEPHDAIAAGAGLPPAIPPPAGLARHERLDHGAWQALLQRFVRLGRDGYARVAYDELAGDAAAVSSLSGYLERLAGSDPGALADGDERLVLYLNAYNASVVSAVLRELASEPGFSPEDDDFAFFGRAEHSVAGISLTLDQLEHGIVRGDFTRAGVRQTDDQTLGRMRFLHEQLRSNGVLDARIHMALNCAALSCPNLQPTAFQGAELDAQLDAAGAAFLANPGKGAGPAGISALFRPDWFADDFAASAGSVSAFIAGLRPDGLSNVAVGSFLSYDWTLNALR
jgi:hypothetical protein